MDEIDNLYTPRKGQNSQQVDGQTTIKKRKIFNDTDQQAVIQVVQKGSYSLVAESTGLDGFFYSEFPNEQMVTPLANEHNQEQLVTPSTRSQQIIQQKDLNRQDSSLYPSPEKISTYPSV